MSFKSAHIILFLTLVGSRVVAGIQGALLGCEKEGGRGGDRGSLFYHFQKKLALPIMTRLPNDDSHGPCFSHSLKPSFGKIKFLVKRKSRWLLLPPESRVPHFLNFTWEVWGLHIQRPGRSWELAYICVFTDTDTKWIMQMKERWMVNNFIWTMMIIGWLAPRAW